MRKRSLGVTIISDPSFSCDQVIETFTCAHCQTIVDRIPARAITEDGPDGRKAVGAWCTCCDAPICLQPWCRKRGCIPIEKWLDQIEARRNYEQAVLPRGSK